MDKLEELKDAFVETAGQMATSLGLSRGVGQLYGLLFVSKEPFSLDEMAEKLKISKGNVSVNIRELERWGAAKKIWTKGSRKDFYEAESDITKVVIDKLVFGLKRRMDMIAASIEKIEKELSVHEQNKETSFFKERLNVIKEIPQTAEGLLNIIQRFAEKK
jgi:DNA-binding transcriptional regulator GbsR (MarR family)